MARLRRRALCERHRRRPRARRGRPLPDRPGAAARRERQLVPADRLGRDRQPLRALRPGAGRQPGGRQPWPAADRQRRLERRHEPRRRRRPGRECLAWLAVARRARRLRNHRRCARRCDAGGELAAAYAGADDRLRKPGLGRRLVSARLVRRRHAARLGDERRVPHRLYLPILGSDLRHGAARPRGPGHGGRRPRADPAPRRVGVAVHAALRPPAARPRLHQGLSAGRARKWRAVHPCRPLVRDGLCGPRGGRQGGGALLDA